MSDVLDTIEFALYGAQVLRYHTTLSLRDETVGHHSHGLAVIVTIMDPNASRELLIAALYHDLHEHVTGDIPSPVKRELSIRDLLEDYGTRLKTEAGLVLPEITFDEQIRLKFADCAQGALACLYEMRGGNHHRYVPLAKYLDFMDELRPELLTNEIELLNQIRKRTQEYMVMLDSR